MTEMTGPIAEAAAAWVVRLNSDQRTRADEEAFRAWLEQDPAHAHAYADCVALWDGVTHVIETEEAHDLLRPLRAAVGARQNFGRRAAVFCGIGTVLVALAAVVGLLAVHGKQTFQTKPGEQTQVRLADGSQVLLNTDTRLRVKFVDAERTLFLDRGQAFFQVAKDKARPFRVFVGRDEIRALGTAFEVRRLGEVASVTLEEGRVAIYRSDIVIAPAAKNIMPPQATAAAPPGAHSAPAAVLFPGDQAELANAKPVEVRQVDLRKVQAWRYGRMILDNAPLGETVADLNRYGGMQIVLADPKLAQVRVSGVFHTGRPEDFIASLTAAFPIQVARQGENTILLQSR
jgi:transmembrane sensor